LIPARPWCARPAVILACGLFALACRAQDEGFDLPSLDDLGVGYATDDGYFQVRASAQIDLEYLGFSDRGPGLLQHNVRGFFNDRARVFLDAFLGEKIQGSVELRQDRGEVPDDGVLSGRVEQAFVRYTPRTDLDLHLQGGKFVTPFGAYPTRHWTHDDWFIFSPLPYSFRTTVWDDLIPKKNDGFIRWKDIPFFRADGLPPVWDVPYHTGVMAYGALSLLDFRLAVMTSGPASRPSEWNEEPDPHDHPTFIAHAGLRPTPGLYVGVNFSNGTYLIDDAEPALEYNHEPDDYRQRIWGYEASFARGNFEIRGEFFSDLWEVPEVEDKPIDYSWYVEGKYTFAAGLFAAARAGGIFFNKLHRDADLSAHRWDYPAQSYDLGVGYRFTPRIMVRAGYQWNDVTRGTAPREDIWGIRLTLEF
jgi:hypothetical protein